MRPRFGSIAVMSTEAEPTPYTTIYHLTDARARCIAYRVVRHVLEQLRVAGGDLDAALERAAADQEAADGAWEATLAGADRPGHVGPGAAPQVAVSPRRRPDRDRQRAPICLPGTSPLHALRTANALPHDQGRRLLQLPRERSCRSLQARRPRGWPDHLGPTAVHRARRVPTSRAGRRGGSSPRQVSPCPPPRRPGATRPAPRQPRPPLP